MQYSRDKNLLLTVYFLFYFFVFFFFALDHRLLSQVRPVLFWYNRDLAELTLIGLGLPRWMIAHPAAFAAMDGLVFTIPASLIVFAARKKRFSRPLGWFFTLFFALYILLADIFWQVHLEPFVVYWLLSFCFLTNDERTFYRILRLCRYYFLYLFVSAAVWKIARGAVFHGQEMSHILLVHHGYLLSGDCDTWTCGMYRWLIAHPAYAQSLYIASVVLEASFLAGFFTRRFDRLLILLSIVFVVADLVVMRIPYWTLLVGAAALWVDSGSRERAIVVYETTHHENLPALLDLAASRFPRVVVFLQELSWQNLCGEGSPSDRWPGTEFVRQAPGSPNRPFIHRLFAHIRRHRCSHLHLSTLDNNLLVFAWRIAMAGNLHVSLTIHEVNAWFAHTDRSIRGISESLARLFFQWRIGHYTFFLPSMAARFQQRLPGASTSFIPSRFYTRGPSGEAASPDIPQVAARPSGEAASPDIPQVAARPSGEAALPDIAQAALRTQQFDAASPFTIVIPGSIDPNRRDYEIIAAFFESWQPARPVRLVLLGDGNSGYAKTVISRLQNVESTIFRLVYYAGYVPEAIYEREIRAAHLFWSPLRVEKKGSRDEPEVYGQTTASGLTADLLLNDIPALVPAGFVLSPPFDKALLSYSSPADVASILDRLLADGQKLSRLRQEIDSAFSFFVKENFTGAFEELMGSASRSIAS
ncbi:MAG TPA: hypothetical protein VHE54_15015 [Puia sp.]|nr:hypothetical protein [Puia sp.]